MLMVMPSPCHMAVVPEITATSILDESAGSPRMALTSRQGHAGFDFLEVVLVHLGARAGHET